MSTIYNRHRPGYGLSRMLVGVGHRLNPGPVVATRLIANYDTADSRPGGRPVFPPSGRLLPHVLTYCVTDCSEKVPTAQRRLGGYLTNTQSSSTETPPVSLRTCPAHATLDHLLLHPVVKHPSLEVGHRQMLVSVNASGEGLPGERVCLWPRSQAVRKCESSQRVRQEVS